MSFAVNISLVTSLHIPYICPFVLSHFNRVFVSLLFKAKIWHSELFPVPMLVLPVEDIEILFDWLYEPRSDMIVGVFWMKAALVLTVTFQSDCVSVLVGMVAHDAS